jgi:hypothetical protein
MGVVAPLSGLAGAGLPLVVGLLAGERTGPLTLSVVALARRGVDRALQLSSGLIVLSGAADMESNILFLLATRQAALGVVVPPYRGRNS